MRRPPALPSVRPSVRLSAPLSVRLSHLRHAAEVVEGLEADGPHLPLGEGEQKRAQRPDRALLGKPALHAGLQGEVAEGRGAREGHVGALGVEGHLCDDGRGTHVHQVGAEGRVAREEVEGGGAAPPVCVQGQWYRRDETSWCVCVGQWRYVAGWLSRTASADPRAPPVPPRPGWRPPWR